LTSGYLKQLQLTKQLEEQAKKAVRDREAAEKRIQEAEALVSSAKEMGGDLGEAQRLLVDATGLFSNKDYKGALGQATKALTEATEAKRRSVTAILNTAGDLIKQVGGDQEVAREPLSLVKRSQELADEDKLDEAFVMANEAWDKTEQYVNARMADGLERAQSLLLLADGEGIKTKSEKELLGQARRSLERSEYVQSIEQLGSCLESVTESLSNLFHTKKREMEASMAPAQELEMDLSKASNLLKKATDSIEEGNIEDAFSHLTIAEGEFQKAFSKGLLSLFEGLEEEMLLLEKYEETGDLDSIISQGKDITRAGDFPRASETYEQALRTMGERELKALMNQMLRLKPKLQIARRVGSSVEGMLEQLQSARAAHREGDFAKAMDLVHRVDHLLEEELKGYREVEKELAVTEGLMSMGERFGVEREKPLEMMRKARGLALVGYVDRSLEQLRAAQKWLHRGIQQHLGSEIMRIELSLAAAMRMGADIAQESALIDEIMARVKSGDYREVEAPLADCHSRVNEQLRIKAEESLEAARKAQTLYHGLAEATSARPMIEEAKAALEAEDFEKAFGLAQKAIQDMEGQEIALMESRLTEARKLLEICRGLGEESSTLNEKLAEVEKLRLDSETKKALGILDELLQLTGTLVREEVNKGLSSLSKDISSARRRGVEMISVEKMAEEISHLIEHERVADAFETLAHAEEKLSSMIGKHKEVRGYMREIASLVEEAEAGGIEISGPKGQLEEITSLFETGDYDGALKLAESSLREAETLVAPLMSPRKAKEAENLLATARRLKQDVSEEENALVKIRSLLEKGEHVSALRGTKEAIETLEKKIGEGLVKELASISELMGRAEEGGKDVASLRQIVDRIERLLEQGKTNDALRAISLVQKELDQGMLVEKRAMDGIERASHVISSVRRIGVEPTEAQEILRQAKEQAQMDRSGIALELAKKAADHAAEAGRTALGERLRKIEMNYKAMDVEGPDLNRVVRLGSEIKEKMEQWRFQEAHSLLESMEEELDRVQKQKTLSEKTVGELEVKVEETRERGLVSRKVKEFLEMARTSLKQGAFAAAFSHATRCSDELHSLEEMYNRRASELQALRKQAKRLEREEGDIGPIMALLEEAERHLGRLEFQEASLNLNRGAKAYSKLLSDVMTRRRNELRTLHDLAIEAGVKKMPVNKSMLAENSEIDLDELVSAIESLRGNVLDVLEKRKEELMGRIQVARNSGADISTSEYLLGQAAEALRGGALEEAFLLLRESLESIGVAMEARKEYMETRMRCESLIENARRNGLIMDGVIELFRSAEERRKTDYQEAIGMMKEALESAEGEAAAYLPDLAVDIDFVDDPVKGEWNRTRLNVRNDSRAMARDIEIEMSGEIEVRGLKGLKKLRGGESAQMEFEIMPGRTGKMEVTFSLSCRPVLSEDVFGFESSFELDVK